MQYTDVNYSDDELTFLPYFTYIWSILRGSPPYLGQYFDLSIQRTFFDVKHVRSSLWNIIFLTYKTITNQSSNFIDDVMFEEILADAVWCLQTWPVEMIAWPVDKSQRLDVKLDDSGDRFLQTTTRKLLPYDESFVMKWNRDPYDVQSGDGMTEDDSGAFLLPFWMAYYFDFI